MTKLEILEKLEIAYQFGTLPGELGLVSTVQRLTPFRQNAYNTLL